MKKFWAMAIALVCAGFVYAVEFKLAPLLNNVWMTRLAEVCLPLAFCLIILRFVSGPAWEEIIPMEICCVVAAVLTYIFSSGRGFLIAVCIVGALLTLSVAHHHDTYETRTDLD